MNEKGGFMKKCIQGLIAGSLMVPALVAADNFSYDFVEGGVAVYPSFNGQDFVGFDLRGSLTVAEDIFAFGGFKYLSDDVNLTALHGGVGYRMALDTETDIWGGVTLEYQEFDYPNVFNGQSGSYDDMGIGLRGGVRHQVNNQLEIGGSARVVTGDLDYVGVSGTARYAFRDNLRLLGEVDLYDGELGLIGGVVLDF